MTVLEVALGVALALSVIYWAVDHLFKIVRIEELEQELDEYWSIWEKKSRTRKK